MLPLDFDFDLEEIVQMAVLNRFAEVSTPSECGTALASGLLFIETLQEADFFNAAQIEALRARCQSDQRSGPATVKPTRMMISLDARLGGWAMEHRGVELAGLAPSINEARVGYNEARVGYEKS